METELAGDGVGSGSTPTQRQVPPSQDFGPTESMQAAHAYGSTSTSDPRDFDSNTTWSTDIAAFETLLDAPHHTVTQNYTDMLRGILGSTAASPAPPGHEQNIQPNDNDAMDLWDCFLNVDHNFGDLMALSQIDPLMLTDGIAQLEEMPEAERSDLPFEQLACFAGTHAFREWWEWGPTKQDSLSAETLNLILPPDHSHSMDSGIESPSERYLLVSSEDRDRLLSLLLHHCPKEQWIRIVPSFPSQSFLSQMLERFHAYQQQTSLPWLHTTTLRPDTIRTELLAILIAAGAAFTPNAAVQRFGYVMPDVLRYAILQCMAIDNSESRDLQLLHAWLTQAFVSVWSGDKRQMEIAEGNYQMVITIIRRARWLRRDHYHRIHPDHGDKGDLLQRKWRQWIDQETQKRLIYRAFVFDAQISIINHVNPLMSYAEMRVPFPDPNAMWAATTAEDWKKEYLQCAERLSDDPLTLADTMREAMIEGHSPSAVIDAAAIHYTLYGFWGLVWDYQQRYEAIQWNDSSKRDDMYDAPNSTLPTQRENLSKMLNMLRKKLSSCQHHESPTYKEAILLLEFLNMVLLIPLQGLQAFVGRDGEQEARRVFPSLQEWTQTREARQSLWHAGQVYKAAKAHSSGDLRDLRIMLVYQASITLWVFGVIERARKRNDGLLTSPAQDNTQLPRVWLDGENDMTIRKFISVSEGVPALRKLQSRSVESEENSICFVEDAYATMSIAIAILRRSLHSRDGAQIAIVESITRLMMEIAKVAQIL
ncbi:hypothetical protein NX059_004364 [Plenodomus lindquistii]|nr:hypothetical protein NX059_004364 [Plenodomus lindquistii]